MHWLLLGRSRRISRAGGAAVLAAVCLVAVPALAAPGSIATAKRCTSAQVKRTVIYKGAKDHHKHTVTACGPRGPVAPGLTAPGASKGVVATVLRQSRLFAVRGAPARITRLQRSLAARRVLRTDVVTDAGADRWFALLSGGGPFARAASSVQNGSDNGPAEGVPQGPRGTNTTMHRSGTEWNDATPDKSTGVVSSGDGPEQNPGFDGTITTETTSRRIQGQSSRMSKSTRIKVRMAICPDATGLGQGPVIYEEKSTQTIDKPDGGRAVITQISTYEGTLKAQFGDDAHLVSSDLSGTWSYTDETRASSGRGGKLERESYRSVGGTSKDTRLGPGNSLTINVTQASDDASAMGGDPTGKWVAGIIPPTFAQDGLERIERYTLGGACVHVVAEPKALSLRSGQSATITAHPVSGDGPFAGHITTYNSGGTLTPAEADAAPEATFTFVAPPGKKGGEHDTIVFHHVSRRGKASGTTVDVTYLPPEASHTYRVMAATLQETVNGERPGSSFPGCPAFSNHQDNTMTLGAQPPPTGGFATQGHLLDAPQGFIGMLTAGGVATATTTLHGCDIGADPPAACTTTGAGTITKDVAFFVTLPPAGPAQLRWTFGFGPAAGLGSEGAGTTCLTPPIAWTTDNFAMGDQTVPRAVFEAATPQQLSFDLAFDLTDPNPAGAAQIHAGDHYTMTIQRVRDDGSPL
jgi:hypothetical protein